MKRRRLPVILPSAIVLCSIVLTCALNNAIIQFGRRHVNDNERIARRQQQQQQHASQIMLVRRRLEDADELDDAADDDAVTDDDAADDAENDDEASDDDNDDTAMYDDTIQNLKTTIATSLTTAQSTLWESYQTPPNEWTSYQWDLVLAGIFVLFMTCCCGCTCFAYCCCIAAEEKGGDDRYCGGGGNGSGRYGSKGERGVRESLYGKSSKTRERDKKKSRYDRRRTRRNASEDTEDYYERRYHQEDVDKPLGCATSCLV